MNKNTNSITNMGNQLTASIKNCIVDQMLIDSTKAKLIDKTKLGDFYKYSRVPASSPLLILIKRSSILG